MNIAKGDRVITPNGEGEVIDTQVYDEFLSTFLGPKIKVKLDTSVEEKCFLLKDLTLLAKPPNQKEATDAISKIKEQIKHIPNLPRREKEELPNHLEYFQEDIQVNSEIKKQLGITNFDYVDNTLKAIRKTDPKADCWNEIESNLKILRWWIKPLRS
jgi:SpoVK/Ycf46/Vps4 family AAA+-type ATPase